MWCCSSSDSDDEGNVDNETHTDFTAPALFGNNESFLITEDIGLLDSSRLDRRTHTVNS